MGGIDKEKIYKGMVVLLVYGRTQSHAEYSTMALQTAPNVITIGSQTAGADGDVSPIEFIGELKTLFSGNGIFIPMGLKPHVRALKLMSRRKIQFWKKRFPI